MAERAAPRVVLLARTGEACDRLDAALVEAGAEVVLIADPVSVDPTHVTDAQAQAVLIALEPAIESALDRLDAVLSDPAVTVIFDEAELAARRSGWEAARWARHLAAKLHRHDDVLPPGSEHEQDWQPIPGALQASRGAEAFDIAFIAGEAEVLVIDVPRADRAAHDGISDTAIDDGHPSTDADGVDDAFDSGISTLALVDSDALFATLEPVDAIAAEPGAPRDDEGRPASFDLRIDDEDDMSLADITASLQVFEDDRDEASPSVSMLDARDGLTLAEEGDDAPIALPVTSGNESDAASFGIDVEDGLTLADEGDDAPLALPAVTSGNESDASSFEIDVDDGSGLSLADPDAPMSHAAASDAPATHHARDLDALAERVSGLSLADEDSYGHGPLRGAVLVEGGLGGPDAVRQLLAALPEEFPRPVLVRLHLDGGRYDRLVKQMSRVTRLPVALAEAGQVADAGTVYFMTPATSLQRAGAALAFVQMEDDVDEHLLAALPANDTVQLFLSGSDPSLAAAALEHFPDGSSVFAQAPEGCYDSTAPALLIAQGVHAAPPAELAARLAERWPS